MKNVLSVTEGYSDYIYDDTLRLKYVSIMGAINFFIEGRRDFWYCNVG